MAQAVNDNGLVDVASVEFIPMGFSVEHLTYWFGQYGYEEGVAVARLNILDLQTNRYVNNTPIVRKSTSDSDIAYYMWDKLISDHTEFLKQDGILDPGILIWSMGPQQNGNGAIADWHSRMGQYGQIRLEKFDASQTTNNQDCKASKIFKLYYKDKSNGLERLIYQDDSLPKSRGCATDYRLRAIHAQERINPTGYVVIIISVYKEGGYLGTKEGKTVKIKRVSQYIAVPFFIAL